MKQINVPHIPAIGNLQYSDLPESSHKTEAVQDFLKKCNVI